MLSILKKIFGSANDRIINKLRKDVAVINSLEVKFKNLTDEELRGKTAELKSRLKADGSLDNVMHEAFALVREASSRVLGMRHFDVQMLGGIILHKGMIAEMRTGEGKTLVSTLPAYLNALTGGGVHIVTVNDYLVKRDAEAMGKLYNFLGLTVGCVTSKISDEERKAAYLADITYCTNNELGFDYLRDNMKYHISDKVLREAQYVLIDEVDSILIDEARTPLVISGPVNNRSELYNIIHDLVIRLNSEHYSKDEKTRTIHLTEDGITYLENLLTSGKMIASGTGLYDFDNMYLVHYVNQALRAQHLFSKDVDYIVKDDKVMIIDEFTGRVMDGRRYSEGLHQALEAKEKVKIQNENQTLASITFQNYFRLYPKLSGMTGTAMTEAAELKDIYGLDVVSVPTHHPVKRQDLDDQVYGSKQDKYAAIVKQIQECHGRGQPVLVGTVSIEKSEEIAAMLTKAKIKHNVLNAKQHEHEAYIIAQAGRLGAVTIATNMAGRGTDIMLGGNPEMLLAQLNLPDEGEQVIVAKKQALAKQVAEEKKQVVEAGGLYIIGTERHESRRIDNQLRGRSGRQGDPGTTRFYLALDDDLMRIFASERISNLLRNMGLKDGEAIHHPMISKALERAQNKVEANHYEIRKNLLKFDNVMNDQRKVLYQQRNEIMAASDVEDFFTDMTEQLVERLVSRFIPEGTYREEWDIDGLTQEVGRILVVDIRHIIAGQDCDEKNIINAIKSLVEQNYHAKLELNGSEVMKEATKYILITTLDQVWKEHLHYLDHLRQGISLRAYGQKDPLNEYKREAFSLFETMLNNLQELFVGSVCHLHLDNQVDVETVSIKNKKLERLQEGRDDPAFNRYNTGSSIEAKLRHVSHVLPENRVASDPTSWGKVARNELCPCGSTKKYKHCHGA